MSLLIRPTLRPSVLYLLCYVLNSVFTKSLGRPELLAVLIVMRVGAVSLRLQSLTQVPPVANQVSALGIE